MQFLDIKTDYAFKKVFGSETSKEILLSFLNSVLDFDKFKKSLQECKNSEDLSVIPKDLNSTIKEAYTIANTANYTVDELELQRKRKEFIYIQKTLS